MKKLTLKQKLNLSLLILSFLDIILLRQAWIEVTVQSRIGIGFYFAFIVSLLIIGIIGYLIFDSQVDKLKQYEQAKESLSKNPTDIKLRKAALEAGRRYYESLRGGYRTTVDEQVIMNDLSVYINTPDQSSKKNKNS
ncbi:MULTISPECIES: hypothetical protein [Planktothrix]|uniref:Uncharacterized protein n=1 Tax=Planktothrix rubescens CCAP 1459/22 TaxID=329571 RepID=A0A6J7ZHT5_PLARU|nr:MULTISPECIES: hypothetical protein [Planktothrix]CAC5341898.1 hypothetical protein PLAN_150016 [Planktothrix rubescens NIVA-CYA 18]CAD5928425.1 hypothetical protein PCC7821_01115 [Planktothrix rubescens NIVA-CYA 18]